MARDNDGHQRSTTVCPGLGHDQRRRERQYRLNAWSLVGMQEISGLASVRNDPEQTEASDKAGQAIYGDCTIPLLLVTG